MTRYSMILEARDHLKYADAWLTFKDYKSMHRDYVIAEFLIEKLIEIYDYDLLDEYEELAVIYNRLVESLKAVRLTYVNVRSY